MTDVSDMELLRCYHREGSEAAFAELVERHLSLVYSAALRHVGIAAQAEEVTQAVFIILARKAGSLRSDIVLESWLYTTTRLTALGFLRGERRRQFREQEAYMQSNLQEANHDSVWNQLAPLLDEAMSRLGKKDRDAVMIRFFKDKSLREVASELKLNETAAQKRVHRAVEKLRRFFTKRGVILPAAVLTAAISTHSVRAAPMALAKSVTAVATMKGSIGLASTLTLVKGTMKTMTWIKIKFAIFVSTVVLLASGAATVAISQTNANISDGLTAAEIFKQSKDAYAALSSYSDEGETVSTLGDTSVGSHKFSIKLARPNLYRIEWRQEVFAGFANKGIVWSAGSGDFMIMDGGNVQKQGSRESALAGATGISGGAAARIPGTFFIMNWGNQLGLSTSGEKRQADEKVGDTDCYVFTSESKGRNRTLWIGKKDFLIWQIRNFTSAEALKATLAEAARRHPSLPARPQMEYKNAISTETHRNIVVNQQLSPADFQQ
ncbi:MAG TPA: sigma-70 family RNA polymerase sigma factor [Verrucomicrobiae bacterium]|nr:sigma-70 family RNA polymerase sigma factor [Verrucomicrobiae bacterium]